LSAVLDVVFSGLQTMEPSRGHQKEKYISLGTYLKL